MFYLWFPLSCLPFYLIGAIPTGFLIARSQGVDIRTIGSGNVGATNVARNLGRRAGLLTLLGDVAKGYLPLLVVQLMGIGPELSAWYGLVLVAGHCFSIPGKLKGGKGVATAWGVLLFLQPLAALVSTLVFVLALAVGKMVSLASVCAALMAPIGALLTGAPDAVAAALMLVALLVIYRHRENMQRIAQGREAKLRFRKGVKDAPTP